MISFAGGLPSAEGFPVKAIKDAADWVLETCPQVALQYSAVGGMPALLEAIAKIETDHGVPTTPDEVMIVSGSQQALDMIARVLTDEGDKVLVETPTYMGALYAFELCKPKFVSLPTDDEGLNPDLIDDRVAGAKFAYVMPTYQNPTGRTISEERRRKLAVSTTSGSSRTIPTASSTTQSVRLSPCEPSHPSARCASARCPRCSPPASASATSAVPSTSSTPSSR